MIFYISYERSDGSQIYWETIELSTLKQAKDYAIDTMSGNYFTFDRPWYASISDYNNPDDEGITVDNPNK